MTLFLLLTNIRTINNWVEYNYQNNGCIPLRVAEFNFFQSANFFRYVDIDTGFASYLWLFICDILVTVWPTRRVWKLAYLFCQINLKQFWMNDSKKKNWNGKSKRLTEWLRVRYAYTGVCFIPEVTSGTCFAARLQFARHFVLKQFC